MRDLYSLELMRLVDELRGIEGFYIDQFYEVQESKFRLKLSRKGEKENLQIILPKAINRTEFIEQTESATNFSMAMRKRITGMPIESIEQLNKDRIICIRIGKGERQVNMILEMFGRGNMVITDASMKILLAYQNHEFKDRKIRPNVQYVPPKAVQIDIRDKGEVERTVLNEKKGEGFLIPYLTKTLPIGSMYLEEAVTRAGINHASKLSDIDSPDRKRLSESISEIISESLRHPKPRAYVESGTPKDFSTCDIQKYSTLESKEFETLQQCLDFVYSNVRLGKEEVNEEAERIKSSIKRQNDILDEIDREISESREAGSYIMNNMHEMNSIIRAVRSNKTIKKESIQGYDGIEILGIDMKTKTIRIKVKSE